MLRTLSSMVFSLVWVVCLLTPLSVSNAVTFQAPGFSPKQSPSTEVYQKAIRALAQGNTEEAERFLRETLTLSPTHVGALMALAEITLKKGDPKSSEEYLKKSLIGRAKKCGRPTSVGTFSPNPEKNFRSRSSLQTGNRTPTQTAWVVFRFRQFIFRSAAKTQGGRHNLSTGDCHRCHERRIALFPGVSPRGDSEPGGRKKRLPPSWRIISKKPTIIPSVRPHSYGSKIL